MVYYCIKLYTGFTSCISSSVALCFSLIRAFAHLETTIQLYFNKTMSLWNKLRVQMDEKEIYFAGVVWEGSMNVSMKLVNTKIHFCEKGNHLLVRAILTSVMTLRMPILVSPPLWSRQKYLSVYWMPYIGTDIHGPQRMYPTDFREALTFLSCSTSRSTFDFIQYFDLWPQTNDHHISLSTLCLVLISIC